mgnify:CR=1 FL=1
MTLSLGPRLCPWDLSDGRYAVGSTRMRKCPSQLCCCCYLLAGVHSRPANYLSFGSRCCHAPCMDSPVNWDDVLCTWGHLLWSPFESMSKCCGMTRVWVVSVSPEERENGGGGPSGARSSATFLSDAGIVYAGGLGAAPPAARDTNVFNKRK